MTCIFEYFYQLSWTGKVKLSHCFFFTHILDSIPAVNEYLKLQQNDIFKNTSLFVCFEDLWL